MTYQPNEVIQGDGSRFQWLNCNCASGATEVDRDTKGNHTTTGAKVRTATGDTSGGTNLDQVDYALRKLFPSSDHLDVRRGMAFADACYEIEQGRGAIIQIQYDTFSGTEYDGSPGFTGGHSDYWNAIDLVRTSSGGIDYTKSRAQIFDPLWDGRRPGIPDRRFRWIPLWMLRKAAGRLVTNPTTGARVGLGKCYVGFSRDTEPEASKPALAPVDYGENQMITESGLTVASSHVMKLKKGQAIYVTAKSGSKVLTRMSRDAAVDYLGYAGHGFRAVRISTARPFSDGITRPVIAFVPSTAGTVMSK